jgi:hypothetical protein
MRFEPGFCAGSAVVHLTHTTLVSDALCGCEPVAFDGEPELAVICDECDRIASELGGDRAAWMRVAAVTVALPRAA